MACQCNKTKQDLLEKLDVWFKYHSPTKEQTERYQKIRSAAKDFAQLIIENTPYCDDQLFAIQQIRSAVMFANASIACEESGNER